MKFSFGERGEQQIYVYYSSKNEKKELVRYRLSERLVTMSDEVVGRNGLRRLV